MKTLSNMLLMLTLSAPLFANNITPPPPPPPPPEKLAENASTQDFPGIGQTPTSSLTNSNTSPLIADATANTNTESKAEEPEMLPPLTVEGTAIEEITVTGQAETYAGGQVTRSGHIGLLGNRDIFDTPFSISSYTAELIENQQTRTVADVIRNDSSARMVNPLQGHSELIFIRGFNTGGNTAEFYDGLPGLSSYPTVQTLERVEVFKGPNALLTGTPRAVGGAINLAPKRPVETSLRKLTTDYDYQSRFGIHADLSRRFGSEKQFGARLNAIYRSGESPTEDNEEKFGEAALALEYRADRFKLETILSYFDRELRRGDQLFFLSRNATSAPSEPDPEDAIQQPWEKTELKGARALLRTEYDFGKDWTMHAAYGAMNYEFYMLRTVGRNLSANGDFNPQLRFQPSNTNRYTWNAGIRGKFKTAGITHQISIETMRAKRTLRVPSNRKIPSLNVNSNLFNPILVARPAFDDSTKSMPKLIENLSPSIAIADTISFLDERVLLTAGIRRQSIESKFFNLNTGAIRSQYDKSANTPAFGLLVKPWDFMSIYGNYIEALEAGPTAPNSAVNAGEIFPPSETEQVEFGVKFDLDGLGLTAGLFQIERPSGITDATTNRFSVDGEQRHRGLELNAFGELWPNLRLLGGFTYIDSKLTRTQGGRFDGNHGGGVPELMAALNLEYDTPAFPGLTLTARAEHTGSQYARNDNILKISSYELYGIGVRYKRTMGDKQFTLRMNIDNLLNEDYWISAGDGIIYVGAPRAINLSFTVEF